jgi:hypothetical protein
MPRLYAQGLGVTVVRQTRKGSLWALPVAFSTFPSSETFRSWGIHTLQALADLPEIGLIERVGQGGKHLQTLARGASQRPLIPKEPELKFEESLELGAEPLTFVLARCCSLCARLAAWDWQI